MKLLIKILMIMAMSVGISFAHCGEKDCKHGAHHAAEQCKHDGQCTTSCDDCHDGHCEKCETGDCADCKEADCKDCDKKKKAHKEHKKVHYVATVGDLEITHAYMRPTAAVSMPTAAYLHIENKGTEDDALLRVTSDVARKNEIHTSEVNQDGVMKMKKLEKLVLPAGEVTKLKPHGNHIMLMGTEVVLPKDAVIPLMLEFERAGSKMNACPLRSTVPHEGCEHHKEDKKKDSHDHDEHHHHHH